MKKSHSKRYNLNMLSCALAACLLMTAPTAFAQSTSATLRGQVAAGSMITVTNVETGLRRTAQGGATGSYTIPGLPPGTYRVEGGSGGTRDITLAVGQVATVNLGQAAPAIPADGVTTLDRVVASAEFVPETKTSEVATYVTAKQIEMLPQNSRNFLAFADTVPGMLFTDNGSESRIRSGAQGANNINVFIDGVGQKNYVTPGGITGQDDSPGNPFPQSAIGEFKVITSNYKAEYDQISSAAITAVTRSGSNDFKGAVFWDRYTEAWRKPTPDEEVAGSKTEEKYEQFGAWVGGAIIKDRLHYFLSYEGKDIIRPVSIEPPAQVNLANLPESIRSEFGATSRPFKSDLYFGKLSFQASDDHLIEFSARRREELNLSGIGGTGARSYATDIPNKETRLDLRSVYSAQDWMNDAHITYESAGYNPSPVENGTSARYVVINPTNPGSASNPNLLTVLNTGSGPSFQDKSQKGWAIQDDFTWFGIDGHTIKAGFKYKKIDLKAFQQFPPFPRYWYDINESMTLPFRVEYTSPRSGRDPFVSTGNTQFGIYIQDDWEVTDKLMVNMGIRWDVEDNPSYTDRVLDPTIAAALRNWTNIQDTDYDIENYISDGGNRKNDKNNFAPRLGFSYDLTGDQRHVIFGGAGRAYDRTIFDYMAREFYGGAFTTYTINFRTPLHPCTGTACIAFNPALATPEGLAAYAAANPVAGGEIQLLNNDFKTPYSDQYSLGMRNRVELWGQDWNTSVTLQHIRSRDNFYMHLGSRRPDGSFHQYEAQGQTWGGSPFIAVPGYGNLILGDNGFAFNQNSLLLSIDKPYTDSSPWGVGIAYTYTDGEENRPNASEGETYLFDYASVRDQFYTSTGVPKHRLVLTGIYSPGWDLTFSSKLVLQAPTPISAVNNTLSPANGTCTPITGAANCGALNSFYDPVMPVYDIGYKQFDLAAEKRFQLPGDFAFKLRADVLNVFNWRNWNQFDTGWGPAGGPVNPNVGVVNGNNIDGPTRTFKLSVRLEW